MACRISTDIISPTAEQARSEVLSLSAPGARVRSQWCCASWPKPPRSTRRACGGGDLDPGGHSNCRVRTPKEPLTAEAGLRGTACNLISPTSMTSAVKRPTPGIGCAVIAHQPEPPVTGLLLVASRRSRRRPRCHGQAWSATACAPPSLRPTHGSLGTPERPCPFGGFAPRCYTSLGENVSRSTVARTRPVVHYPTSEARAVAGSTAAANSSAG